MTKKIFRSIFAVATLVFLACLAIIMGVLYDYYGSVQEKHLLTELALAADGVERGGGEYLMRLERMDERLTWVAADGSVLFDSQTDTSGMENHAGREEIHAALESGSGTSTRYSSTLTEETVYFARRLGDGSVLRISISRYTVFAIIISMLQPFIIILAIVLLVSFVLANRLSKKIVRPLEALDLEHPLENKAYDELAPMLKRLEQQHRQIRSQRDELKARRSEFMTVIGSMKEGLVLVSAKGVILSMNAAAARFFGAAHDCTGEEFTQLERSREVTRVLEDAMKRGSGEAQLSRGDREYSLSASSVVTDGEVSGVVLLIIDVTERIFAERTRREFTANVSHELKTPLQSIMGSAELMENGLVREGDMPQFIGRIRSEASRLVSLIDDIIRLSQLDEKADLPVEELDLTRLVSDELEMLTLAADDRHVTLRLVGDEVRARGVRQLVREIVFNLCDNAIKYNVDGGSVTVEVKNDGKNAVISVADTGIGIPKDAQDRIFERFYRVDKSHSRKIGGTGLGLSIVKHAAQYMDGRIAVQSEPALGTTITVTIPQ
ncbi:MAG: PAS domain S-box protein [Oscillospiraceae bacterium]|nr:PAS domain S-box protein [Oscillospiraceae bacterium]